MFGINVKRAEECSEGLDMWGVKGLATDQKGSDTVPNCSVS